MGRHARVHGLSHILRKGIGSHGNNRDFPCIRPLQSPYPASGFISVHFRHLDIHENRIIGSRSSLPEFLQRLRPIGFDCCFRPINGQQLTENLCIDGIILRDQEPSAGKQLPVCGIRGFSSASFSGVLQLSVRTFSFQLHTKVLPR